MPPTTVCVLEIGGTHVTAASVDATTWQVRERSRTSLDSGASAERILATLSSAARAVADSVQVPWAIAIPDPFDYVRGIALFRDVGKFDALYGVDMRRALYEAIHPRPTRIAFVHDTEAFLRGEWTRGAAVGTERCAALTIGSGIGSAFLAQGREVRKGPGLPPGGRIHRLHIDGAPLEHTVSRRAIRARYAAATGDRLADVREIAERARAGNPPADAVLRHAFRVLGRALAPAVAAFRPEVLVVGGSMSASWDLIERPLAAGLAQYGITRLQMRPGRHPMDAPLIGAAQQALQNKTEVGP